MKSRDQLMKALCHIEDALFSEYQLRAETFSDNEPTQEAMRDAFNLSRVARGQKTMEPC